MVNIVESAIPNDFEAEQAVLGSIIFDNETMNEVSSILIPSSFYAPAHQYIFRAMLELSDLKQPIDEVLLGDQLKSLNQLEEVGSYSYLAALQNCVPSSGNIVYYAKIIREHAQLRNLISVASDIARKSRDPEKDVNQLLIEAETKIREIAEQNIDQGFVHIKDVLVENFNELEELSKGKEHVIGIKTGFIELDIMTSGLLPADLIIVAARPGMGKTAFALNISSYAATMDFKPGAVAVVSREMQNVKLSKRMLAAKGGINTHFLKTGKTKIDDDWDKLTDAVDKLSGANIFFNEKAKQIDSIINQIKSLNKRIKDGVKLVIIDYLQIVRETIGRNREQEISSISGKLKDLAKDLNIPVIALSQLNRSLESRTDKRPELSDLRESGSLEQDADIIMFIYRDDYYNPESQKRGIAEIIIKKHRDGPTGTIELVWQKQYTRFCNPPELENQSYNNQQEF